MQCSKHNVWDLSRCMRRAGLLLLLGSLLSGCLPGLNWGDDEADNASPANAQGAPALNRDYKTNFLSLQMPSLGVQSVQAHLMPDIGPLHPGRFLHRRVPQACNRWERQAALPPRRKRLWGSSR